MVIERQKINKTACVFHDMCEVCPVWEKSIVYRNDLNDLARESVLLHTLTAIGERSAGGLQQSASDSTETFLHIKKYIDVRFSDPEPSLELLNRQFGYSEKYIICRFLYRAGRLK